MDGCVARRGARMLAQEEKWFYLFISPWLVGFLVFMAGPIVAVFVMSFSDWDIIRPLTWIGAGNYGEMLSDPLFWQSLKVTAIYTLASVPLNLVASLVMALLLNHRHPLMGVFRTIYYLPAVISGVAVALLWIWIFNPKFGILNYVLARIGIEGPEWIFSPKWVLPSLILMSLWGAGAGAVICLSGLQGVPAHLYESAELDGAGAWSKFWNVTIPMISPVLLFNLITGVIASFQMFTQAFVMTNGGPANASLFYLLYLFRNAFRYFRMGYASALAVVLSSIILVCTLLLLRITSRWVYYESEK